MASMDDPRDLFFNDIDLKKCRIKHTDHPIVLLCGGKVAIKERPEDLDPEICSFRHAFSESENITPFEIFRPEEITTWHTDGVFKNLMDFEKELASICSLVVVILESAGSIAELGAFSQHPELSQKLVVINAMEFSNSDSFINLGLLRYLEESNPGSVSVFPWDVDKPSDISSRVVEDSIDSIKTILGGIPETSTLNTERQSHATTVLFELLHLFVALKENEIIQYLIKFGFDSTAPQVKRKIFLLTSFGLIKKFKYGGATFYCAISNDFNRLRLAAIVGARLDSTQIAIDSKAYYEEKKDRHRLGAIKQLLDSRGSE